MPVVNEDENDTMLMLTKDAKSQQLMNIPNVNTMKNAFSKYAAYCVIGQGKISF